MKQKERLVDLIIESVSGCARNWAEVIADHLIANGVIVPPCKVGDLIYMPWEYGGTSGVALLGVTYMVVDKGKLKIMTDFYSDDEEYFDLYFGG